MLLGILMIYGLVYNMKIGGRTLAPLPDTCLNIFYVTAGIK